MGRRDRGQTGVESLRVPFERGGESGRGRGVTGPRTSETDRGRVGVFPDLSGGSSGTDRRQKADGKPRPSGTGEGLDGRTLRGIDVAVFRLSSKRPPYTPTGP